LTKPEKYIVKSDAITFDEKVASVIKQLKENDNKFLADADLVISGSVEAFVNVAVERVGLSLLDLETAFRISKTIALSGGSKTVAAIDIAEALQYVSARHGKNLEYIGTI
jgi:predicted ATPase with chaperone activity